MAPGGIEAACKSAPFPRRGLHRGLGIARCGTAQPPNHREELTQSCPIGRGEARAGWRHQRITVDCLNTEGKKCASSSSSLSLSWHSQPCSPSRSPTPPPRRQRRRLRLQGRLSPVRGRNENAFQRSTWALARRSPAPRCSSRTTTAQGLLRPDHPAPLQRHALSPARHAHRGLPRLSRQGHRLEPDCQGPERHHQVQRVRHRIVGPLHELGHHLQPNTACRTPSPPSRRAPGRGHVQVQRHDRRARGHPVVAPTV